MSVKVISGNNIADKAFEQYALMKDDMEIADIDLSKLGRLDDFYFKQLKVGKKYPELASVIMVILTLSHGQADVERGFSVNPDVLEDNIKDDSIVSKRLVKDYMTSNKLKPHTVEITSQMRAHCRRARQRYHQHLEEQKKNAEKLSVETAKEVMTNEINELQDKIDNFKKH